MDRPRASRASHATARQRARTLLPAAILTLFGAASGQALAPASTGDRCPTTPHRFESFALEAPALERAKRILVYLPPGYDCDPGGRYPALYVNDGHDLFDWDPVAATLDPPLAAEIARREGWYGSWHLEAQLDGALAAGSLPPLIVVGIASDDGLRSRDLAPVPWSGSAEARGLAYGDFVAATVVPAIEARFRVATDRRCRGIAGASLGGVSALQIGLAHPELFGLVLALSPLLTEPAIAGYLARSWRAAGPAQAYLVDFDDNPLGAADRRWLGALVGASGPPRQVALLQSPGGHHALASWRARVLPALTRLLAGRCRG
jgi:enterochelin esterase-like enzyme